MRRVKPSSSRSRLWMLWLCALAVLAKSSMPYLAEAAAERQGRALVEVCTVYGVATVAVEGKRHGAPDPGAVHTAEHCALTALTAFAGVDARAVSVPAASPAPVPGAAGASTVTIVDAAARWAALLRHGPPRTS